MKKTFLKTLVIFSLIGGIAVTSTSCKKKGCTDESASNYDPDAQKDDGSCTDPGPQNASEPTNPQPQPQDADAVLIALQTVSEVSGFEVNFGLPVAIFLDGASFKDVGAVTCETKALEKQDNNSYIYMLDATSTTEPFGVIYSGDIDWTIEGNNGFPAHTKAANGIFPSNLTLTITNGDAIDISGAYTLATTNAITNADSVYFGIYGPENAVVSVQPGTVSSHTFTAAEMESVGAGGGFVQVAAVNYAENEMLSTGELIYYINEKVNTTTRFNC